MNKWHNTFVFEVVTRWAAPVGEGDAFFGQAELIGNALVILDYSSKRIHILSLSKNPQYTYNS